MLGFLAFIQGPWGTLIGKAMMVLTLITMAYVAISQYNASIAEKQAMKDKNAQLEQVIKDNKELGKKLDILEQTNGQILIKLDAKNEKVIETHDKVTTYITSPEGQKTNRPSSDVIKHTIGILRNDE
jgi:hypothetical protein